MVVCPTVRDVDERREELLPVLTRFCCAITWNWEPLRDDCHHNCVIKTVTVSYACKLGRAGSCGSHPRVYSFGNTPYACTPFLGSWHLNQSLLDETLAEHAQSQYLSIGHSAVSMENPARLSSSDVTGRMYRRKRT
eukprot:1194348-Prorocentrum_minimum.AAC.7